MYDPVQLERHLELAAKRFPGPDYYASLAWIHEALQPRTYVDIGVRHGASLACAGASTRCIAIDPTPDIVCAVPPDTRLITMTSDEFFRSDATPELSGFDLALIDGLHLFEQSLRDFIHLERCSHGGSVILVHDCMPLDEVSSARERTTDFYSGDVWKLPLCLRKYRPEVQLAVIPTGPSGLCVASNLDRTSTTLSDAYAEAVREFAPMPFAAYTDEHWTVVIDNNAAAVRSYMLTRDSRRSSAS